MRLSVRQPFRLDLTADALRRVAANAVDLVGDDGTYYRAVRDARGAAMLAVSPSGAGSLDVRASGRDAERWLAVVRRLLGTDVDLSQWYVRTARIGWLHALTVRLNGLKPPRYPTLWEACAHAIVFQQISIAAGAAIMQRLVELLGEEVVAGGVVGRVFPQPERWMQASEPRLRAAGLSRNKLRHLRSAAQAFADGTIDESRIDALATPQAAQTLTEIAGIGPWSASVMLLRGLGRLDAFPLRDSGVARSLLHVGGDDASLEAVLAKLGPVRGMLYFHLLLGRLHGGALRPPNRRQAGET